MALAYGIVEGSIPEITWCVDFCPRLHQRSNLFHIPPRCSNVKWSLAKVTDLIHVFKWNLAERRKVLVLVATGGWPTFAAFAKVGTGALKLLS
jgi:hypothetical protein